MKLKIIALATLALALLSDAQAQSRGKKQEDDFSLKSRLWYGLGFGLGLNRFNNANIFGVGISPTVGFKIFEPLSIGPRLSPTFTSYKESGFKAVGLWDVELGLFLRGRLYRGFFVQGEVSNQWREEPAGYDLLNRTIVKAGAQRVNQYLGIGYNFGYGQPMGYEISAFYNFTIANDFNSFENPLQYRMNITWRF